MVDDYRQRALELIQAHHQRSLELDVWLFEKFAERCESPIEYLLAGHLFGFDVEEIMAFIDEKVFDEEPYIKLRAGTK